VLYSPLILILKPNQGFSGHFPDRDVGIKEKFGIKENYRRERYFGYL
jgi:hypothetical protein